MKKSLLIGLLLLGSAIGSQAQNNSSLMTVKGDGVGTEVGKALNIYVGPTFARGFGGMVMADFEIPMFTDNLTLGPTLGMGVASYHYLYWVSNGAYWGGGYYETRTKSIMLINAGVVAHYYFDWLIPNMPDKYDVFAKIKTAALIRIGDNTNVTGFNPLDFSAQVGGRINFSESMSLYGAVGYGHSNLNIGFTFKL